MRRLACILLFAIPACSDDGVCPDAVTFTLTGPDGFAELVPGGTVTVAWTSDADAVAGVALEAIATDSDTRVALPPALIGDRQLAWNGKRDDGWVAPPANYRIGGTIARSSTCTGFEVTPDDLHLIVVQGLRMPADPIAYSGSQLTRMFTVTTVTRSPLMVRYALDPDGAVDGDELVFLEAAVPGEFAPVPRSYPFSGMTVGGAAIPDGTYDLVALVGLPTAYRALGPRLTWHPAQ